MTRRIAAVVAIVAVLASAAWLVTRDERAPRQHESTTRSKDAAFAPREGGHSSATTRQADATRAAPAQPPARKRLFDEYLASPQYLALYERLKGGAEGDSPQGRLVVYEILRECATVTGGVPWPFGARRWNQPKRDELVAAIAGSDPQRERRIAAYDKFTADRCAGLSSLTISQDDLLKLLRDSAAGGEPAAKALSIEQDLWAARRSSGTRTATPSDMQIEELEEAAATRDPEAVRVAGRVLANNWTDYSLRVGAESLPVEPRPFVNAWLVLACEYGAPCGPDTPRMLQMCAFQGRCDAQSFPDYLAYYESSPYDSTLLAQYRSVIRNAIETGDWTQIQVVRGQAQGTNRPTFIPGPR